MSELVVVFAICGSSLLLAAFHVSGLLKRRSSQHALERLLSAVRRACADFLWRETKILASLLVIVSLALACLLALWGATAGKLGETLAWSTSALGLGAATAIGVAHATHWAAARATTSAMEGLRQNTEAATAASYRGAAAAGLIAEAASLLVTCCFFTAHYAYLVLAARVDVGEAIAGATRTLPVAALGAFCAAAVFQVGGCGYHTAAGVAGRAARARHAQIAEDEEQNPALVAELVGDYVGAAICRSTDVFSALLLGNCGLVLVAAFIAGSNSMAGLSALGLTLLPLVVRGVGLLAACVSLSSLRFEGSSSPSQIFAGGRASQALLLATGLLGASLWLLGEPLYLTYFGAGALGILASFLSATLLFVGSRRLATAEDAWNVPRQGEASVARALGVGMQYTWSPLLVVGACLGAAWLLGARAPLERGGVLALVVAVAAMLGAGAFNLSESLLSTIAESIRRLAGLRRGELDAAARERAAQLDAAAQAIGNVGHTQCILGGATAALLAAVMLPFIGSRLTPVGALPPPVSIAHPVVIIGGVLGAGSLLFYVGGVLRSSSKAAGALEQDLLARLESRAQRAPGSVALPSYRDSVELASAGATNALLPLVLSALLTPFLVGILLRVVYGPLGRAMTTHGLTALGTIAALTGCCAALAAQGTVMALASQHSAPPAANRPGAPSLESAREFMGRCVGPAALLGLKAGVVSSLAAVPLLFST